MSTVMNKKELKKSYRYRRVVRDAANKVQLNRLNLSQEQALNAAHNKAVSALCDLWVEIVRVEAALEGRVGNDK